MEKHILHGMVGILISPGYGAGWSTWCHSSDMAKAALMDKRVVEAFINDGPEAAADVVRSLFPNERFYDGGGRDLEVHYIPIGTQFMIHEYDGSESLRIRDQLDWHIA